MADQFRYKLLTDLTAKDAPSDTDLFAVGNNGSSGLRKLTFASIANAIKTKLLTWTFTNLTTSSKTLPGAVNELNSNIAVSTQLLSTSGIPATATSYSLNKPFTDYNFLLLEFRQYGNIWSQYIIPTQYFNTTNENTRPTLFYMTENGVRTAINIYKNTESSVYVKSNIEYSAIFHVVITGLFKK